MYQVDRSAFLDHIEPFDATAATSATLSAGCSGRDPQSTYLDTNSNKPLDSTSGWTLVSSPQPQNSRSAPSNAAGPKRISGISAQQRTGKAALRAQRHRDVQLPVKSKDSGIRFNQSGEQVTGPLRLLKEFPPSYSPR